MAKQRFQILIEPEQRERLSELSKRTGASIGEIIRRAIDAYLKQPEIGLYLKHGQRDAQL